ncbi:MAG: SDR family oxidoreductase [Polyangiaceae bacterium]|nr:SDR family oxidoreductase [Polyangiaceae bacterium]
MKIDLSGKTAIVTGSSAGIGWGCARGLALAGATVIVTARRREGLEKARNRLLDAAPGATVRTVVADLSSASGCEELIHAEPRCDILVNNLGIYDPKPFVDISDDDWLRLFHVNVMSGVRLSRTYMPTMMAKGWGRVVFVSSQNGVNIPVESLHYGVTKAAVLALSRGLAKLAARSGVTVNAVLPGVTRSEWVEAMIQGFAKQAGQSFEEAAHAAMKASFPTSITQRIHAVEEVANLVVYLCSTQSSATTGSALRADGGIIESIC